MTTEPSADDLRRRLVAIRDEIRSLAPTDFAGKHRLNTEADDLRRQLAERPEGAEIRARWAERAGRKNAHAVDDDLEAAKAAISSPIDGGANC